MADSKIGSLPVASEMNDDSLLVVEQSGTAVSAKAKLLKGYAAQGVSAYVASAQAAAEAAEAAAQEAVETVEGIKDITEDVKAAQAAAQAAETAAQAAQAAKTAAEQAAETAASDAVSDVGTAMQGYVDAAKAAQAAAEQARDEAQAIAGGNFLPLAGGTMTGPITLAAAPIADMHAASKKYVDDAMQGVSANTDAEPTAGSTNPVQSGGVYTALQGKEASGSAASALTEAKEYTDNAIQAAITDTWEASY